MMAICSGVVSQNAISFDFFGRNSSHTMSSSAASVYAAVKAWNECGSCCACQPIHVGSGPFS